MVTIESNKCDQCGLCIKTCHQRCIELDTNGITIDNNLCSKCTHCIAICPQQALSWNQVLPQLIDESLLPTQEQLREFLMARRSAFHYEDRPIDRAQLKDIVTMGKYSPTNNYNIEVAIVDDLQIIRQLESLCIQGIKRIYNTLFKPKIMRWLIGQLSPEIDQAGIKMEASMEAKRIFHNAPVLLVILADPRIRLTVESVQYFMYNIQLYAQTVGIGSRVSGGGKRFLTRSKVARKLLGIPKGRSIEGILTMGYPQFKYQNKVEGIVPQIYYH